MPAAKHFECPHCENPVPASLEDLHSAAAALTCPSCEEVVYLTMGRISNYQGEKPESSYDSGA